MKILFRIAAVLALAGAVLIYDWSGEKYVEYKLREELRQNTNTVELQRLIQKATESNYCADAKTYLSYADYLSLRTEESLRLAAQKLVQEKSQQNVCSDSKAFGKAGFMDHWNDLRDEFTKDWWAEQYERFRDGAAVVLDGDYWVSFWKQLYEVDWRDYWDAAWSVFTGDFWQADPEDLESRATELVENPPEVKKSDPPDLVIIGLSIIAAPLSLPEPILKQTGFSNLTLVGKAANNLKTAYKLKLLSRDFRRMIIKASGKAIDPRAAATDLGKNIINFELNQVHEPFLVYWQQIRQSELGEIVATYQRLEKTIGSRRALLILHHVKEPREMEKLETAVALFGIKTPAVLHFTNGKLPDLKDAPRFNLSVWQNQLAATLTVIGFLLFAASYRLIGKGS